MKDRRDFLKLAGMGALIPLVKVKDHLPLKIEDEKDFLEVPNFHVGMPMRAKDMQQLTNCILQLQNEVNELRKKL